MKEKQMIPKRWQMWEVSHEYVPGCFASSYFRSWENALLFINLLTNDCEVEYFNVVEFDERDYV